MRGEIDRLIDTVRDSKLTREQALELFYAAFEDRANAKLCEPCAEAGLATADGGP